MKTDDEVKNQINEVKRVMYVAERVPGRINDYLSMRNIVSAFEYVMSENKAPFKWIRLKDPVEKDSKK